MCVGGRERRVDGIAQRISSASLAGPSRSVHCATLILFDLSALPIHGAYTHSPSSPCIRVRLMWANSSEGSSRAIIAIFARIASSVLASKSCAPHFYVNTGGIEPKRRGSGRMSDTEYLQKVTAGGTVQHSELYTARTALHHTGYWEDVRITLRETYSLPPETLA